MTGQNWDECDGLSSKIVGDGNRITREGVTCHGVRLLIRGNRNLVSIGQGTLLRDLIIDIRGDGHVLKIGEGSDIRGVLSMFSNPTRLMIGKNTSFVNVRITAGEGADVEIGEDCLLSRNIEIRSTDQHGLYDLSTRKRLNMAAPVWIMDHVWIGEGVTICKGVRVAQNCVIGAGSVVTKSFETGNCVVAGSPAMVRRKRITWARTLQDELSTIEASRWTDKSSDMG